MPSHVGYHWETAFIFLPPCLAGDRRQIKVRRYLPVYVCHLNVACTPPPSSQIMLGKPVM